MKDTTIIHVGIKIKAKTADIAYQNAQTFNKKYLNGTMKAIIVDEIDRQTFWVTLAPNEKMATAKHYEYLEDNGFVVKAE